MNPAPQKATCSRPDRGPGAHPPVHGLRPAGRTAVLLRPLCGVSATGDGGPVRLQPATGHRTRGGGFPDGGGGPATPGRHRQPGLYRLCGAAGPDGGKLSNSAWACLRLGLVVNFLSHPVVNGFTNAAAIIIATGQLPKLFGVTVDSSRPSLPDGHPGHVEAAHYTHWPTLLMGVLAFADHGGP